MIALPAIYSQLAAARPASADAGHAAAMPRLHQAMRFAYVGVVSPAAFVAVASGTVLVFQGTVVAPWFGLKLAFVAGLVIAHSLAGLAVARQSEDWNRYAAWRSLGATGTSFFLAAAIIGVTLWKPTLPATLLPTAFSEPGALKGIVEHLNPWHRP